MTAARIAFVSIAVAVAVSAAWAQTPPPLPPPPPPARVEPPPVTPPPPPEAGDTELEPQVTIIRRDAEVIEEVRVGGELRYIRVTPRYGRPYFLVPDGSGQAFIKRDSLDIGLKVPLWVLFSW
jgi:hypothetical protein